MSAVELSVIVVCFNAAGYLRQTLESIQRQSLRNLECLVIDGGSTDGTLEILHEYPWATVHSEADWGYHDAFLKGLDLAQGEFITQCCVSDGYLSPTWFEDAVALLKENSDCDLAWGYPQYMSEEGLLGAVAFSDLWYRKSLDRSAMYFHYLAFGFHLPEINYVVRANVLRKCFRRQPGAPNSDLEFESWLEFENNFHHSGALAIGLRDVVSYGRVHGGSITQTQAEANRRHFNRFQDRRRHHIKIMLQEPLWSKRGLSFRIGLARAWLLGWSSRLWRRCLARIHPGSRLTGPSWHREVPRG